MLNVLAKGLLQLLLEMGGGNELAKCSFGAGGYSFDVLYLQGYFAVFDQADAGRAGDADREAGVVAERSSGENIEYQRAIGNQAYIRTQACFRKS